jgi:cytochrome P450
VSQTGYLDPFTAVAAGQRHEVYRTLARGAPVRRIVMPTRVPAWLVTGQAEVRQALSDPRLVKAISPAAALAHQLVPDLAAGLTTHMLRFDPPDHTRLRRLVGAVFTRRRVDQLAPRIQAIADTLLDELDGCTDVDLIPSYALPLPMTVICELIGVPTEARADFRAWTEVLAAGVFADADDFVAAATDQIAYVRELAEAKERHPADDLLSALVAVREGGDRLSRDELTSMVWVLVVAGHETTVNLIANGVHALLTHPDQLDRLRADPELIGPAVEELLRFESPLQITVPLRAAEPVDIAGTAIAAGEIVLPALLAANRDPSRTADPGTLDIGRRDNPHVAFGHGIHHCLGAPLARLEGRIALAALLQRFPRLRLTMPADELSWRPNVLIHGLTTLPVTLR